MTSLTFDISKMDEILQQKIGQMGFQYIAPQIEILRMARNLPKNVDDERLIAKKFRLALDVITKWLEPVSEYIQNQIEEMSAELLQFQETVRVMIKEGNITSWKQAMENPEIKEALEAIKIHKNSIVSQQQDLLHALGRQHISTLFGLVLYPYLPTKDLSEAVNVAKSYLGPNYLYSKNNIYADAFILMRMAQSVFSKKVDKTHSIRLIEQIIEESLVFVRESEKEQWTLFTTTHKEGRFSPRQVDQMIKSVLGIPRVPAEMKEEIKVYYDATDDQYTIIGIFDWLLTKDVLKKHRKREVGRVSIDDRQFQRGGQAYLLGLSFLDRHSRTEIIGNVPESSFGMFERIMGPFTELKQSGIFIKSAQFGIDAWGLPEQAWLIDFTGIKSDILRSTLLLISEKQPKFDALEAAQRFCNAVLGGRVDRNDLHKEDDVYIYTNKLPRETWDYIGNNLVNILEEALVREETAALRILRSIFVEEDRSNLVTSKRFVPAFQVELTSRNREFQDISIYAQEGFEFQYRHAGAAGYPWFYESNSNYEGLVIDALKVSDPSKIRGNVVLRQVVYEIDDEFFIIYYHSHSEGLSVLAFREADILEGGISPVEILFRPQRLFDRGPKGNQLKLILEKARATDPKDLATVLSSL